MICSIRALRVRSVRVQKHSPSLRRLRRRNLLQWWVSLRFRRSPVHRLLRGLRSLSRSWRHSLQAFSRPRRSLFLCQWMKGLKPWATFGNRSKPFTRKRQKWSMIWSSWWKRSQSKRTWMDERSSLFLRILMKWLTCKLTSFCASRRIMKRRF